MLCFYFSRQTKKQTNKDIKVGMLNSNYFTLLVLLAAIQSFVVIKLELQNS